LEIFSNDPFQQIIRVELAGDCRGTPRIEGLPSCAPSCCPIPETERSSSMRCRIPRDSRFIPRSW
jgi:hypothetical protein